MKKTVLIFCSISSLVCGHVAAQSRWSVFLQQMAGMETYLRSIKSLYSTTQNGLNTLHELKSGSFTLNQTYFNSLGTAAPAVKNNAKVSGIGDFLKKIELTFQGAISWQQDKQILSSDEISYIRSVYSHLLEDCNTDLQELALVINDGTQMSDAARIQKIDQLYNDMQDKYAFSRSFTAKAGHLAEMRAAHSDDNQTIQNLYGLN